MNYFLCKKIIYKSFNTFSEITFFLLEKNMGEKVVLSKTLKLLEKSWLKDFFQIEKILRQLLGYKWKNKQILSERKKQ